MNMKYFDLHSHSMFSSFLPIDLSEQQRDDVVRHFYMRPRISMSGCVHWSVGRLVSRLASQLVMRNFESQNSRLFHPVNYFIHSFILS